MTTHSTGFNATSGPLIIDRTGHLLGGGEFGVIRPDEQPAKGHLAAGRLVEVTAPRNVDPERLDAGAVAAFADTVAANRDPSPPASTPEAAPPVAAPPTSAAPPTAAAPAVALPASTRSKES